MPIINGKRRIPVVNYTAGPKGDRRTKPTIKFRVDNRVSKNKSLGYWTFERGGIEAIKAVNNMTIIREHYGVNISDAIRISLHLAANAIRANRALPEVNND